jgi:phosphomannomutase
LWRALPAVINTPELRFPRAEDRKLAVVGEVAQRLRQAGAEVNAIDGVRVRMGDGWWLLRASNTQDVLVARAESTTAEGLVRLKAELASQLAAGSCLSRRLREPQAAISGPRFWLKPAISLCSQAASRPGVAMFASR